ncbi:MAG: ATP-binding protein [Solirubrobacteraceae bacterium]
MRPPTAFAVEQFAQERERLADHARELAEHREQLDRQRGALADERSRLALATKPPTVEDLGVARAERDEEWRRLRARLDGSGPARASPDGGNGPPSPFTEGAGAHAPPSPDGFEGRLRHADDVADIGWVPKPSVVHRARRCSAVSCRSSSARSRRPAKRRFASSSTGPTAWASMTSTLSGRRTTNRSPSWRSSCTKQLYLALRLASLERHVALHGPMPVILDDVVLHSDPRRKSAILGALADLGRRTQVIAFIHDPQVVALAQNAIDPDLLTVHELDGEELSGALGLQIATADVRPIRPAKAA